MDHYETATQTWERGYKDVSSASCWLLQPPFFCSLLIAVLFPIFRVSSGFTYPIPHPNGPFRSGTEIPNLAPRFGFPPWRAPPDL